jgi:hypothetical protein
VANAGSRPASAERPSLPQRIPVLVDRHLQRLETSPVGFGRGAGRPVSFPDADLAADEESPAAFWHPIQQLCKSVKPTLAPNELEFRQRQRHVPENDPMLGMFHDTGRGRHETMTQHQPTHSSTTRQVVRFARQRFVAHSWPKRRF